MRRVLYLHGFASSPASRKIVLLRPLLEPRGIVLDTPDLNAPTFESLDFDAIVQRAADASRLAPPGAIAGSSLGALVALALAREGLAVPMVLIAPAIGIGAQWESRLPDGDPVPVWNHDRDTEVAIHRRFFQQMNEVDVDDEPPRAPVTVIMGEADETIPFDVVADRWRRWKAQGLPPGSKFIPVPGGDHSLTDFAPLIADAIADAARERVS